MKYVQACERGDWHLAIWPRTEPTKVKRIPFHCRSWRHEGDCRLWKGSQDFARIKEAMEAYDNWCHITLTYDPRKSLSLVRLFRVGVVLWAKLRKRMTRRFGKILYIQTWEIHRSQVPHVHLAVCNTELFAQADMDPVSNWKDVLQVMAHESGFGYIGWLERLRTRAAMAGYLTKLARELTGSGKEYQVPTNAPPHFRRLRASQGLLPKPLKDPELTGKLHFCPACVLEGKGTLENGVI